MYKKLLSDNCKINFHFCTEKESKVLKWRDLTGTEKLKLFSNIKILYLFPQYPEGVGLQQLWDRILDMYGMRRSKNSMSIEELDAFKVKMKAWSDRYFDIYQTKHATPYIHLLTNHIYEMLNVYESLALFPQQGVEKSNDVITQDYFKSTNHRDSLQQILLKLNRLEDLNDAGCSRTKVEHVCGKCNKQGHNSRTCVFLN